LKVYNPSQLSRGGTSFGGNPKNQKVRYCSLRSARSEKTMGGPLCGLFLFLPLYQILEPADLKSAIQQAGSLAAAASNRVLVTDLLLG
jgi:hypothetical protein